jgi:hypothetical protein
MVVALGIHQLRMNKWKILMAKQGRKTCRNDYIIKGDITEIILRRRDGNNMITIIDTDDLPIVQEFTWHAAYLRKPKDWYAHATSRHKDFHYMKTIALQRLVTGCVGEKSARVDHENQKALDNRKDNLRVTTNDKNSRHRKGKNSNNTSGYRNVSMINGKPIVQLQDENGKNHAWRDFKTVEEAGAFAEKTRNEWYGEFAGKS